MPQRRNHVGDAGILRDPWYSSRRRSAVYRLRRRRRAAPPIVSERFARKYLPGEDPIGRRVFRADACRRSDAAAANWLTIVGVVGDVKIDGLETEPAPLLSRRAAGPRTSISRSCCAPRAIRRRSPKPWAREVRAIDPNEPVYGIQDDGRMSSGRRWRSGGLRCSCSRSLPPRR